MSYTEWQTPRDLFNWLNLTCEFKVDAAANGENHLLPDWYGPGSVLGEDALAVERWLSPAFCNPPYGRGIETWLDKFIEQERLGSTVVALLPANVETRWWYEKVVNAGADIFFLVGRVPYLRPDRVRVSQPDHPTAVVMYQPQMCNRIGWLDWKEKITNVRLTQEVVSNEGLDR